MNYRIFLYGTLCDPALFRIVAGTELSGQPATLDGAAAYLVEDQSFPVLVERPGASASGLLVEIEASGKERLDFYELGFGYDLVARTVATAAGPVAALVYVPHSEFPPGPPWSLTDWQWAHGKLTRLAAQEYMRLMDTHSPEDAARAFPQIRMRAASRLRAMDEPSPSTLKPLTYVKDVRSEVMARPYTDYFSVQEDHLTFARFGGGMSPVVKRASFLGGDAVTVLPFDPATGLVMMVRQFRHGPYARGDSNPWSLEPAAGRIDPGETPEEAAQRELREETGIAAGALHFIGRYYPSPGAYSEYLYSYVAAVDLKGRDGSIGGLEDEAEDIMAHVVPLDEALAMTLTGEANTAPLVLSLQWIALNRDRLI